MVVPSRGLAPCLQRVFHVRRMKALRPALTGGLLAGQPGIVAPSLIAVVQRVVGEASPDLMRNGFREEPEPLLPPAKGLFRPPALEHVGSLSGIEIGQAEVALG